MSYWVRWPSGSHSGVHKVRFTQCGSHTEVLQMTKAGLHPSGKGLCGKLVLTLQLFKTTHWSNDVVCKQKERKGAENSSVYR